MTETPAPYTPVIPPILRQVQVSAGSWNKFMRILIFGESKSGKSYFLASMPKPILMASGGDEQGIAQYLDPSAGDMCFDISTPDQLLAFVDFGLKNMAAFRSLGFDPITPIWTDYMDHWSEQLGGDIKGGQWKKVKAPWNLFMRQVKRSKMDVGMSAWVNDFYMEEVEEQPGIKKVNVGTQEVPKVEKRIPHHVDLILQSSIVRDRKRKPTPIHEIAIVGGRRPRTIPPSEFHTGKKWSFDERQPVSPWETIIEPLRARWQDAAAGAVDFLGLSDPQEASADYQETEQVAQDYTVGSMLRVIGQQTDLRHYKDEVWPKEIAPFINGITDESQKQRIIHAHEAKKAELSGGTH